MIIVEVNDPRMIGHPFVDGYLFGLESFSSEVYQEYRLDELKELIARVKSLGKIAFLDLTSMYHDQDKKALKEVLDKLSSIDGIFYHDMMLHSLAEATKLVYYAPTYNTNRLDLDLMCAENAYVVASSEVGFDELINLNTKQTIFLTFGTWEIFHSRRNLLTNYYQYRGWKKDQKELAIEEELRPGTKYPIIEHRGTKIYLNGYYYLASELKDLKEAHYLFKFFNLGYEKSLKVLEIYQEAFINKDFTQIASQLHKLGLPLHQGLLYQKSILLKEEPNDGTN